MAPRNVTREDLSGAVRAALGGGRRLESVERLAGQTRIGAYRLGMDDGSTAVAYLWEDSENFWPPTQYDGDPADPFSPCPGVDMFDAAYSRLASLGLRVPQIYLVDRDRCHYLADIAIVEDFPARICGPCSTAIRPPRRRRWPGCARGWQRCALTGPARQARSPMSMRAASPAGGPARKLRWPSVSGACLRLPNATAGSPTGATSSRSSCANVPRWSGHGRSTPSCTVSQDGRRALH
jgi:hypothetical protein